MAVGDTSGMAGAPRKVVSSGGRKKVSEEETIEAAPLIKEADPEIERLLAEEEEIERRTRESHETPHFRANED
jgi:small subunit ribosomal protein S3